MWSAYDIALYSPSGTFIAPVEAWTGLQMCRTVNAVGACTLSLPWDEAMWNAARKDAILDVWRRVGGAKSRPLGAVWLLAKRGTTLTSDGTRTMQWTFVDTLDLLRRVRVMYADGTAQAVKTSLAAETIIKTVATEQMITRLALPVTIEGDAQRGYYPMSVACAWQDLLSLFQQVCQSSTQSGTYMAFDFAPSDVTKWALRVLTGQRGTDRSQFSPTPLTLSVEAGDLSEATYEEDYSASASSVTCGGQVSSGAQVTSTATNAALDGLGPFAHTELYTSAQNTVDTTTLAVQANADLRAARPTVSLSNATIPQTESCILGRTFDLGDRVTVRYAPIMLDARLDSLTLSVDGQSGEEKVVGSFSGEIT
jgi:hypothetical protein